MIRVASVSKTFKRYGKPSERLKEILFRKPCHKRFTAVDQVSFEVKDGQTLGIVGQNGAGKSTLLKLLTGILIPDRGQIHITGRVTGLLELGTGFNPEFSGMDNIIHNATYLGLSRREINDRLDRIIAFTELGDFIHEPIKTYSSGMVMRLAFSVAIHAEPRAFVVDEALSVGDAYFQQKCMRKIQAFKEDGGSIVFVSHDMNAVKVLCDKALLLNRGRVDEYGDPETIINTYNFLIAQRNSGTGSAYGETEKSRGYGNRKVTIEEVMMADERQQKSEVLISGRPAGVAVRIRASADVADLTLGMVIRDKLGQDMFGTNSHYLEKDIPIRSGQTKKLIFEFDAFNLGPGKYSLTVALHRGASHVDECFHWRDRGAVFEVVPGEGPAFAGLVRLTPELRESEEDNG